MQDIIAENENVYIRLMTIRDTAKVLEWRNSDYVRANFIFREAITEEMHEDYIRTKINEGKVVQFVIGYENSEVGCVYFQNIDPNCESAEYGIFLSKDASGKGIGYKASKLAIDYMFDEFGFESITLRVLDYNKNAMALYEKLGFKRTGEEIVTIDGKEEKVIFMKIG